MPRPGLSHVHESGYMHLDFKPENILVTRNGGGAAD